MAYTTIDKPTDYFNTVLYTGDGNTTQSITGVGFQPDWIWLKNRDSTDYHRLVDIVRGATKTVYSNDPQAEVTNDSNGYIASFDTDGLTVNKASGNGTNTSGNKYVTWNWLAGGSASSNTDGSITSSVSANTTAGFSIVSYTGNSTGSATFGHGLGSTPKIVIIKCRSLGTESWQFWFNNTSRLNLNSTVASLTTHPISTNSTLVTTPSSSNDSWNTSGQTYIAYCFAEKKGYSKFGSYTGNGSTDGTFVYTGFKPAMVIGKASSRADVWWMHDNKRDTINPMNRRIMPHSSSVEGVEWEIDYLSNGFKIRTTDAQANGSGETYIYMAFAENPFVTSGGIPTTAR